jgi:hypothetical protein
MKYLIGLVVLAGAIIGVMTLSSKDQVAIQGESSSPSPSGSLEQGLLLSVQSTVELKRAGQTSYQVVDRSTSISQGDAVRTNTTGRARIKWPNGTITVVEEDSEIVITTLQDGGNKSSIQLVLGDVWAKVNRVLGTGEYYEIESDDAVAAVRGTVFRMRHRNKETSVQGIERTVRLMRKDAQGKRQEAGAVDLPEGFVSERILRFQQGSASGTPIPLRRLTDAERKERILQRILQERDRLDELFGSSPAPVVSPRLTASPRASATPTPLPVTSTLAVPSPTLAPVILQTPLPTPTPAPTPVPVVLQSTFPSTVSSGETFSLEGNGFTVGRNTPVVASVFVGSTPAKFSIVGSSSIFVTPTVGAGTYDVTVVTTDDRKVTLPNAITIR